MAGRGRWYLIGGGLALVGLVAGGAFLASRAGEPGTASSSSASAGATAADAASPGAAVSPGAAPAQGPAAAAASPATSRDWAAGTGTGPAAAGGAVAESGAPPTVLVEAVNLDPPVTVQVLSAKRVTPDTLRVELALVSRSAAPEALDLRGLTVASGGAGSTSGGTGSASRGAASGGAVSAASAGSAGAGGHAAARPAAGGGRRPLGLTDLCLVTADGGRRLFALRDDQGQPVGAGDFAPLAPNERRVLWAVFPAPPVADTQVTLLVGSVTLRNVPIS